MVIREFTTHDGVTEDAPGKFGNLRGQVVFLQANPSSSNSQLEIQNFTSHNAKFFQVKCVTELDCKLFLNQHPLSPLILFDIAHFLQTWRDAVPPVLCL